MTVRRAVLLALASVVALAGGLASLLGRGGVAMTVHILRVPIEVRHTERGRVRWCFQCRKCLAGTYALHVPTDPMSYYEPNWSYTCDGCGEDNRLGFGWEWLDGVAGPGEEDRQA